MVSKRAGGAALLLCCRQHRPLLCQFRHPLHPPQALVRRKSSTTRPVDGERLRERLLRATGIPQGEELKQAARRMTPRGRNTTREKAGMGKGLGAERVKGARRLRLAEGWSHERVREELKCEGSELADVEAAMRLLSPVEVQRVHGQVRRREGQAGGRGGGRAAQRAWLGMLGFTCGCWSAPPHLRLKKLPLLPCRRCCATPTRRASQLWASGCASSCCGRRASRPGRTRMRRRGA